MSRHDQSKAMREWAESSQPEKEAAASSPVRHRGLRQSEVAWICSQLATTQGAGMPIYRSLGMLSAQKTGTVVGDRLQELQQGLNDGKSLAQCMKERTDEYSTLVVALVGAGEQSGGMELALRRAADTLNSRLALRRKVRTAMLYPAAVLAITMSLVAVLITVVVPKFETIYAQTGGELPALTQFVVGISRRSGYILAVLLILGAAGFWLYRRSRNDPGLRRRIDMVKFRIPLIGKLSRQAADARVASTLASLMSAGVSLMESLEYAADASGSTIHATALMEVRERLSEGSTLAAALERTKVFPELMVQLVAVGEESGSLSELLGKYAVTASEQVEQTATALTTLIEPAIMVVIGGVVGVFLLALYLPIISVSQNIR